MILDQLENIGLYTGISTRLTSALRALRDTDLLQRPDGRYELQGNDIYAMVQSYQARPPEQCRFEAHRKYIDIQCVIEGTERIGVADAAALTVTEGYNAEKDVQFFAEPEAASSMVLRCGQFAIFFPHDAHAPCRMVDRPISVRKVVVKVAL